MDEEYTYIYNRKNDLENCYLLKDILLSENLYFVDSICILHNNDKIKHRIKLPKIVLVNLCVVENFPIPRLSLSVGAIASYIRMYQAANVFIIDMQMRINLSEVEEKCEKINPDIIGISVSFGQKKLCLQLISEIQERLSETFNPKIVVGNVLPSLYAEDFLDIQKDIFVSHGEGEECFLDIIGYIKGEKSLEQVCGISYKDKYGNINTNSNRTVDIDNQPFPALDTINDLLEFKGALTLELSRGCNYAKCSFCPRIHKGKVWRQVNVNTIGMYLEVVKDLSKKVNIKPNIFLADEEFLGQLPEHEELDRIFKICTLNNQKYNVKFDASARIDSIYDPKKSEQENMEKLKIWEMCARSGLNRLFLGVESGCDNQLKRFCKGITVKQSVIAIRLITALGINIRIGYISFDPLMEDTKDLVESMMFVGRTDLLMNKVYGKPEDIFSNIITENKVFLRDNVKNEALYSKVSYMLTTLEVLVGSEYYNRLKWIERTRNVELIYGIDSNMARYEVRFLNNTIGLISKFCQKWIDYNFSLMYTIKSLYKTEGYEQKETLMIFMKSYRYYSFLLLKSILYNLNFYQEEKDDNYEEILKLVIKSEETEEILGEILWEFRKKWAIEISKIKTLIDDEKISDSVDGKLLKSIVDWENKGNNWILINDYE